MSEPSPGARIVQHLNKVLADTYAVGIKTHGAHWNVKGAGLFRLHTAFGEQYQALFAAADVIAERIRALGSEAPGSLRQLLALTSIEEPSGSSEQALVRMLCDDHRRLAKTCHEALAVAKEGDDEATADLLIGRVDEHDKTAWMLAATLGD